MVLMIRDRKKDKKKVKTRLIRQFNGSEEGKPFQR